MVVLNFVSVHRGLSSDREIGVGSKKKQVADAVPFLRELGGLQVLQLCADSGWDQIMVRFHPR